MMSNNTFVTVNREKSGGAHYIMRLQIVDVFECSLAQFIVIPFLTLFHVSFRYILS